MDQPKPPAHLHTLQVVVATLAGIVSIVGGVYSIRANLFQGMSPYGQLTGYVRDERLARPLRLATVEVVDSSGNVFGTLSTNDEGLYLLKDLKEGNYQVRVSAPLHEGQEKRVVIEKGGASTVDFNLTPAETSEPTPASRTYEAPAPAVRPQAESPNTDRILYRRRYDSNPRSEEEGLTQRQPTQSELLMKAGALLVQQVLEKKKKDASTPSSG